MQVTSDAALLSADNAAAAIDEMRTGGIRVVAGLEDIIGRSDATSLDNE